MTVKAKETDSVNPFKESTDKDSNIVNMFATLMFSMKEHG